ncbi:MAG: hypothetical protein QOD77_1082 [Thermoplasmata archaeon]|jgi:DNA repair exonuclease SbcCD ATPase subunit|nr:hypothetical protein [Thermoplasmata archaeon]
MASSVERRTVTTRTLRTEGTDQIKTNLSRVSEEISRVRDRAREEVNSLERIKGMLDVGYLNDLIKSIEQLEVRMETLETEALTSARDVDETRAELQKEQERLAKLWEAYKAQEDELTQLRRDSPLLQERVTQAERQSESLKREVARLEPLSRYKSEYDAVVRENQTLRVEVESLSREARRSQDELRAVQGELVTLREEGAFKGRAAELQNLLEEERERLAKLYKVYEEQAEDLKSARARLDAWEAWVQKVLPAMDTLCRHAGSAPRA